MTREYEKSHPWISFSLNLKRLPAPVWLLLGEAKSKCEHIAGVPLMTTTAENLHRIYLAKGAHATTAIEGNTLSEQQVLDRLEGKRELPPSKEYLGQEIDNIVDAFNRIKDEVISGKPVPLSVERIKQYNAIVLRNLKTDPGVMPGEIRTYSVGVEGARYRGAPAQDCEYLLSRLCDWLNRELVTDDASLRIPYAIIRAILIHVYIAWIHPFGDGNGRTARLVEFEILLAAGASVPMAVSLCNHYNSTRQEYYRQLRLSSESGGNVAEFILYAVQGLVDELRVALKEIRDQQWNVAWRDYIYEVFRDLDRESERRRRQLLLDLSDAQGYVPMAKIRELSPRVAVYYKDRTDRTISSDVNKLVDMGLVVKTKQGIRARREQILAFLPARVEE